MASSKNNIDTYNVDTTFLTNNSLDLHASKLPTKRLFSVARIMTIGSFRLDYDYEIEYEYNS